MASTEDLLLQIVYHQATHTEQLKALHEDMQELRTGSVPNGNKRVEALEVEAEKAKVHRVSVMAILSAVLALLPFSDKIATFFGLK